MVASPASPCALPSAASRPVSNDEDPSVESSGASDEAGASGNVSAGASEDGASGGPAARRAPQTGASEGTQLTAPKRLASACVGEMSSAVEAPGSSKRQYPTSPGSF